MRMNEEKGFSILRRDPVYLIGVICAIALLVFAVYFIGPWYPGGATSAIGAAFDSQAVRTLLGSLYLVSGAGVLLGIKNTKYRRWSTFGVALAYFFVTGLRVVFIGFVPLIWLFSLCLALVAGVVYLHVSLSHEDEGIIDHGTI